MFKKIYSLILLLFFTSISIIAEGNSIKVGYVLPGEIDMGGFNLSKDSAIEITGLCASFDEWNGYLNYYAWIVETKTRKIVWHSEKEEDYSKTDGDYDVESEIELKAGNYEIYFAAGINSNNYFEINFGTLQGIIRGHKSNSKKFREEYFVKVSGENGAFQLRKPFELVNNLHKDAIVAITRVGDSEKIEKRFSLNKDTEVDIYGVGEGVKKEFYDFGYIYDVSKNKTVWMFNRSDAMRAGGGRKNVAQKATITLPKGSYSVNYKSDDSHSFDEWNVKPPYDPQHWGIVVSLKNKEDKKNVIPFRKEDITKPIVEIVKVEEDEFLSKGISVSKSIKVRILSIGEGYKNLADYGWITNADTKEIVWRMNRNNSEYAGGSKKNRMFDGVITLEAGNYIVNFVTDDSHNYDDWNASPPFDEERWGITIWPSNKDDAKYVSTFNAKKYKSKNLIAEITKVGDDEKLSKRFTLSQNTDVKIIALGEGTRSGMDDFAWITNDFGEKVWIMRYKNTTHAGGAKKNRLFNDVINLDAGNYKVHYKTDDSHSFEEWNSNAPDTPEMYGITLLKVK
jgi:hypothetical protein